jgi:hypothetical protein
MIDLIFQFLMCFFTSSVCYAIKQIVELGVARIDHGGLRCSADGGLSGHHTIVHLFNVAAKRKVPQEVPDGIGHVGLYTLSNTLEVSNELVAEVKLSENVNRRLGCQSFDCSILLLKGLGRWIMGLRVFHPVNREEISQSSGSQ